jgi:Tol biopolymer transport system component
MSTPVRTATVVAGLTLLGLAMLPEAAGSAAATGAAPALSSMPQRLASDPGTDVGGPALSYTGRYVAYHAHRRDQAPGRQELRRTDLTTGNTELLNPPFDSGVARGKYSMPPVISADGTRIAFTSNAARLVPDDTNGTFDAFVRDASTDTTFLASAAFDGGIANGATGTSSLSKNGRYAVFTSLATDVVPGSTTKSAHVYRRDLAGQTTVRVTVRPDGSPSKGPGANSTDVSADGNIVAFTSYNTDLAPADGDDHEADLFARNMTTGQTRWLSQGLPVGANPDGVVISPDGQWISTRWAIDGSLHLTRVDTGVTSTVVSNGYALLGAFSTVMGRFVFVSAGQPYVRDLSTGTNTAIPSTVGGFVTNVSVSGNGQFAAYDWFPDDGGPSLILRVAL